MQAQGLWIKARKHEPKIFLSGRVCDFQPEAGTKNRVPILVHHHVENVATTASVGGAEAVAGRLVASSQRGMNQAGATALHVR